jgi:hypothetical protein
MQADAVQIFQVQDLQLFLTWYAWKHRGHKSNHMETETGMHM